MKEISTNFNKQIKWLVVTGEVERQTPDTKSMEVENGMAKTNQCGDIGKVGNSHQNQRGKYYLRSSKTNDIVGNSKLNDVNFKRIEIDESNTNDV